MSNFKRTFTDEFEFDGDSVSVTMTTCTRQNMMTLAPFMTNSAKDMPLADQMNMFAAAAEVLPQRITAISGLNIEGVQVTRENDLFNLIMEETYFMELVGQLVSSLMEHSSVSKADQKKSSVQPGDTSPA